MNKMIAYCGLDCEKCEAYLATINNDQALREKTAELWSKWNNTTILPEQINCQGCRTNGIRSAYCESLCDIRPCAEKKGVETCGDCPLMEMCEKLKGITSNSPEALENLKKK